MADMNIQKTSTTALSPEMQTFYDKLLLANMRPNLVHLQFGQKKPIPKNSGKTINFRKVTPFSAITTALTEGVVPDGQSMEVTEITATIAQYGGYVSLSDMIEMTAIDDVAAAAVEEMGAQGGLSVDTIARNLLVAGSNVQYAGGKSHRYSVTSSNVLSSTEIRKAVRTLKNNQAKPFKRNGRDVYIAIVSPNATYDLQSDTLWQDVSKYQESEKIFSGEIGRIFGVIFVETTQVKQYVATDLTAASTTLTIASWTDGTKTAVVDEAITAGEATALAGQTILISDTSASGAEFYATIASATAGAAGSAAIVLTQAAAALGVTPADGDVVYPGDAGASGATLEATLILGENAYGVVEIESGSNVRSIIKPKGSAGTNDPLEQFSTVAWKVEAFTIKILQDAFMVRVEHGISA